jgi:hypothetical protein
VNAGRFTINLDASTGSPSLSQQLSSQTASTGIYFQIEVDSGAANGTMNSAQVIKPRIRAKGTMFSLSSQVADSVKGVNASTAEMNDLVGVTALIQTQINALGASLSGKADSSNVVQKSGDSMSGNLVIGNSKEIRLSNGTNFVGLKAPASGMSSDLCGSDGAGGDGGAGGGSLYIEAIGQIQINANISANGGTGTNGTNNYGGGGGGGSGGGIDIRSKSTITIISGVTISANGGNGGNSKGTVGGGGGGGGGIIFARGSTVTNSGTLTVTGGTKGSNAGATQAGTNGSAGTTDTANEVWGPRSGF